MGASGIVASDLIELGELDDDNLSSFPVRIPSKAGSKAGVDTSSAEIA